MPTSRGVVDRLGMRWWNRWWEPTHLGMLMLVRYVWMTCYVGCVEVTHGTAGVNHAGGSCHGFLELLLLFTVFGAPVLKPNLKDEYFEWSIDRSIPRAAQNEWLLKIACIRDTRFFVASVFIISKNVPLKKSYNFQLSFEKKTQNFSFDLKRFIHFDLVRSPYFLHRTYWLVSVDHEILLLQCFAK